MSLQCSFEISCVLFLFLYSEPCPPNNVQTNVNCLKDQETVSWEASWGAVGYVAQLAGRDGHSLTCHTNDTFCNVEGLHCGVIYHTTVIAVGETLNSSRSITVLLVSGNVHSHTGLIYSNTLNPFSNTLRLQFCTQLVYFKSLLN